MTVQCSHLSRDTINRGALLRLPSQCRSSVGQIVGPLRQLGVLLTNRGQSRICLGEWTANARPGELTRACERKCCTRRGLRPSIGFVQLERIQNHKSHRSGLNRRPLDYESSALPLSYCGRTTDGRRRIADCSCCHLQSALCRLIPHALARIRTETPYGTTPSRWRVYQFHHQGDSIVITFGTPPAAGATGFEPATSRVTVECSNQTELRPQKTSRTPNPAPSAPHSVATTLRRVAPTGVEPVSAP